MPYVIRNGKLEKAKPVAHLTPEQKKALRISTKRQSAKLKEIKAKLEQKAS